MMDLPTNKFLADIASSRTLYGCWLGLPDANVAEIAAGSGFDWLMLDHEHAPFELGDLMSILRALAPYDVAPIVRAVDNNPALLKKLLDMGVQSLLIPMVDTPEQARACVEAVYYPPRGSRGVGTSIARAARWNRVKDYLHKANEEICLIVQAETVTAIQNLDAILQVEGIDAVFLGPSDLAASMGYIGQGSHPEVVKTISAALGKIRKAGKSAGILSLDEKLIGHYQQAGANFIGTGVDTLLLGNAMRELAQKVKGSAKR